MIPIYIFSSQICSDFFLSVLYSCNENTCIFLHGVISPFLIFWNFFLLNYNMNGSRKQHIFNHNYYIYIYIYILLQLFLKIIFLLNNQFTNIKKRDHKNLTRHVENTCSMNTKYLQGLNLLVPYCKLN